MVVFLCPRETTLAFFVACLPPGCKVTLLNRYYVVDLGSASAARRQAIRDAVTDGGIRQRPEQLLHWRRAEGEVAWLIQAEVSAAEHNFLTSGARANYVTYLGDYDYVTHTADAAVFAYLAANPAMWADPGA